jgi:hypothetical protein
MPLFREAAKSKVDLHFSELAKSNPHRDAARQRKRIAAQQLLAGQPVTSLDFEASLRRISSEELAQLVLSKPDELQDRENNRQQLLIKISTANTPQELDEITNGI